MKIVCAPKRLIPSHLQTDTKYFSAYSNPQLENVGYFAPDLRKEIQRSGLCPSVPVWDFATIALAAAAADNSLPRDATADGWTRQIKLTVHLCEPTTWEPIKQKLENVLRFLTGDFWELTFEDQGVPPPAISRSELFSNPTTYNCVSLLSGGADSLVGAIDLVSDKYKPIFVSQTVRGDAKTQRTYAKRIWPESTHFQWSHKIHLPDGESEVSTRSRSIIFFAFAALAASTIKKTDGKPVDIYVPENGFISLNIPLNAGRMGSLSTKTTHPVYLTGIQNIWDKLNMNIRIVTPYQFKTKGEMLEECKNRNLLCELLEISVSCGKYRVHKMQHCGRCVPCMVRRAAFLKAGIVDSTAKGYKFNRLDLAGLTRGPNDVGAMTMACLKISQLGIQRVISGNLSFAKHDKRRDYEGVVARGFNEVELLLKVNGMI